MFKERIQEVFEFTTSESPYRKANKGWLNQDIFLDLSPSANTVSESNETAKVTLFWSPINSLLSNIFLIIIACSIIVFTSIMFAKERFNFNFFNKFDTIDFVRVQEEKAIDKTQLNGIGFNDTKTQKTNYEKDFGKSNKIDSLDDNLVKTNKKVINKNIDKQDSLIKDLESNKEIKILRNKKAKSNFI